MELEVLEAQLSELVEQCERMLALLEDERGAIKAWQVDRITVLLEDKEATLAAIQAGDEAIRERLERLATRHCCTPDQLFSAPGADRLRELRAQVRTANEAVRRQGDLNRRLAEHVVTFLARMRGDVAEERPPRYGSYGSAYSGGLLHQVI